MAITSPTDMSVCDQGAFAAVLQTHGSLPVVLRATYPENQVAMTENK